MRWRPEGDRFPEDRLLRDFRAVTDVRLGNLQLEDLLVELLDRVRVILGADTAAVLLLEATSGELVVRAARGVEEEIWQGTRVRFGQGFAGRIAAEMRPRALDRVDATTLASPAIWEKSLVAMLGVPLVADGKVLGVVHIGTRYPRRFNDEDTEVLGLVGQRILGATQVRLADAERAAGNALQRSLLPDALPAIGGLEFAARYVPAGRRGVGGDWYDAFRLPSGEVWVVTGDVAGHGLPAAIVMGRLRSTVRAYALGEDRPEEVLRLTDRKVEHFEVGELATVLCAVFEPSLETVSVCGAGHLPPVVVSPGRPARFVDMSPAPPLGTGIDVPRKATRVDVPPGTVLLFYTDGLVERRDEPVDVGLDQLLSVARADEPRALCRRVMEEMVGDMEPDDDIALLAVRRSVGPSVGQ